MFTCGSALSPITDFKLYGKGPETTGPAPSSPVTTLPAAAPAAHTRAKGRPPGAGG